MQAISTNFRPTSGTAVLRGVLTLAGAALLVASGAIHLHLWQQSYSHIPTIGNLFLAQAVGTFFLAAVVLVWHRVLALLAGGVTLLATAIGLLVDVHHALFGFRDSLSAPYAHASLFVEFIGVAVFLAAIVVRIVTTQPEATGSEEPGPVRRALGPVLR